MLRTTLTMLLPIALTAFSLACTRPRDQERSASGTPDQHPADEALCPTASPADPDELRFTEAQFTEAEFDSSFVYFDRDLPTQLHDIEKTADLTHPEGFWIGYGNRLRLMKGYMLKQAALLERARRSANSSLATDSTSATFRFCAFLANVHPID